MHMLLAYFVYYVAILWTLAVVLGVPSLLVAGVLPPHGAGRGRALFLFALLVGGSYLGGGLIGWQLRPPQWNMPFAQTFEAAFNAEKYGHQVESQAERVLMYPWYTAVLCSIAVAAGTGLVLRLYRRAAAPTR